jgi:hypothetical protein
VLADFTDVVARGSVEERLLISVDWIACRVMSPSLWMGMDVGRRNAVNRGLPAIGPAWRRLHLLEAVVDYQQRNRRFGGLKLVANAK